jgi:hypothetical protein
MCVAQSVRRLGTLALLCVAVWAPAPGFCWSGYNSVTMSLVTLYQGGQASPPGALIKVSPVAPSDTEGCTYSGQGYVWIDWSGTIQPDGKAIYASLLAAHLAGKTVGIGVNGCSTNGYPLVYGINVYP